MARARKIAKWDADLGINSDFFFQIRSGAYNLFSQEGSESVRKVQQLGHRVGLHAYVAESLPPTRAALESELKIQVEGFSQAIGFVPSTFSFHRPPQWVLEFREDEIGGLINAYGPTFFEYTMTPKSIKYIADSRHAFNYGDPFQYSQQAKIQLLLHPDEWSESGEDLDENFSAVEKELLEGIHKVFLVEADHYPVDRS